MINIASIGISVVVEHFISDVISKFKSLGDDEKEKQAAWEFYVELSTRALIVNTDIRKGYFRELLTSYYSFFKKSRDILISGGEKMAYSKEDESISFAVIVIYVLNYILRPFLSKWHPQLEIHENSKPENVSVKIHEENWDLQEEFLKELKEVKDALLSLEAHLAILLKIQSLVTHEVFKLLINNQDED